MADNSSKSWWDSIGDGLSRAGSRIADGATALVDGRAIDAAGDALDSAGESISNGWEATKKGAGIAADWVTDTAAPVTAEGFAHVGSVILAPVALASEVTGIGNDTVVMRGISERASNVGNAITGFTSYAVDNPTRATALAGQGVVNGVTSIVGMAGGLVGDAARGVWNAGSYLGTTPIRAGAALFSESGEMPDNYLHIGSDNPFAWTAGATEGLTEFGQLRNYLQDNEGWQDAFGEVHKQIKDADGNTIDNENYNYELTLLYGPQVITESVAFVGTAGVGGLAFGAARGGRALYQTAKAADTVHDLQNARYVYKAASSADDVVRVGTNTANQSAVTLLRSADDVTRWDAAKETGARWADFMNPLTDGKIGKGVEVGGVSGAFAMSVNASIAEEDAKIEGRADMTAGAAENARTELQGALPSIRRELGLDEDSPEASSDDTPAQNDESAPAEQPGDTETESQNERESSLSQDFGAQVTVTPKKPASAASEYTEDRDNILANTPFFNNRATGTFQPFSDDFTLTIKVSEEQAAEIESSLRR